MFGSLSGTSTDPQFFRGLIFFAQGRRGREANRLAVVKKGNKKNAWQSSSYASPCGNGHTPIPAKEQPCRHLYYPVPGRNQRLQTVTDSGKRMRYLLAKLIFFRSGAGGGKLLLLLCPWLLFWPSSFLLFSLRFPLLVDPCSSCSS